MKVNVISNDKKALEFEVQGIDQSIAQVVVGKLNNSDSVEFVACKVDHPLVDSVRIIVKTKKGDPVTLVLKTLEELKDEVGVMRKDFKEAAK